MTKKICHLTSVHKFNDTRIFLKECCSLTRAGYEVHLVAPNAPDEIIQGVHLHGLQKIFGNRFYRMTQTVLETYQKAQLVNAELYHFHDPELIPVGLALKAQGKKVVYDVHEDVPRQIFSKEYLPQHLRFLTSQGIEKLEKFATRRFDAVVTATPYIQQRFSKLDCCAIAVNNYPILNELYITNVNWEKKERAVCYVGGITESRGIFEIVEAIGETNAHLLLAGQFTYPEQRKRAVVMPGWVNVQELGMLNRPDVAQILYKSMAGLVILHPLINYVDALPVKMFEYMSAGIPVIASNFSFWQQIVEHNQCGICIDPMNSKAISEAILWIVDHPQEAKRMGENGRKAVENKYNWDKESKKIFKLYEKLL